MTHKLPRRADARFSLHPVQPRANHLTREQRKLCSVDHAFMAALRARVSSVARWDAFAAGVAHYAGNECRRCHSLRKRVSDGSCYDCALARNATDFALIRVRHRPPAQRSLDSLRDIQARQRKERRGEHIEYRVGEYTARQYPTGRVHLTASIRGLDMPDLAKGVDAATMHRMADADPAFMRLLERIGWASRSNPAYEQEAPAEASNAVPALPDWLGSMQVRPYHTVLAGNPLGGPVEIAITRCNGYRYTTRLHYLEPTELEALLAFYWQEVPACIRSLGETPEAAYRTYVAGYRRGHLRS